MAVKRILPNISAIPQEIAPLSVVSELSQAVDHFASSLSAKERQKYQEIHKLSDPAKPDVVAFIDHLQERVRKERKRYNSKVWKSLSAIEGIANLLDIVIGGSQNLIACSVWAIVKFVLQVSSMPTIRVGAVRL